MKTHSLVLTALAALAPALAARTDAVPHDAGNNVFSSHFWVAHVNAGGLQAFSAFAGRFDAIAGTSATVVDFGTHGFLAQEGAAFLGYSARRHATAPAPLEPGETVSDLGGLGEVFHLRSTTSRGDQRFHAYSTQTNTWATYDLGSDPLNVQVVASTGLAFAVLHHPGGVDPLKTVAVFGARKASWVVLADLQEVHAIRSFGNVVALEVLDNFHARFWAFSAVHNVGAFSEEVFESGSLEVRHNIAAAKTFDGMGSWRGSAFSAYDATWVASDRLRPTNEDATLLVRDNWVALHDGLATNSPAWEAIGARPHQAWAQLAVNAGALESLGDALIVRGTSTIHTHAFSGLAGGTWVERVVRAPRFPHGGERFGLVEDRNDKLHPYSPLAGDWAVDTLHIPTNAGYAHGESVVAVWSTGAPAPLHAYSPRWNEWVHGPTPSAAPTVHEGDFVIAWEDTAADELWVFDPRRNAFEGPVSPGGATVVVYGHQVLLNGGGMLRGYSTERGTWETYAKPSGPIAFPLTLGPVVLNHIVVAVDAERELVAIGTTNDVHQWHGYPDGTEYHAFAEDGDAVAPTRVVLSIRGELGDRVRTYYAEQRRFNPLNLPMAFTGKGWLQHPVVRLSNTRLVRDTEVHLEFGLPTGPPANLQIWTQSLTDKASGLPTRWVAGDAPEPLCIF